MIVQKVLASVSAAVAAWLANKLGSPVIAAGIVGTAVAAISHYFHLQPAPSAASVDDAGSP